MPEPEPERLQRAREALEEATRVAASLTSQSQSQSQSQSHAEPTSTEPRERRRGQGRRRAAAQGPPEGGAARVDADPDPEAVARTVALNLLNHSARSRAQLAEAMARKDVPVAVADRVLDRFEEVGLVDDAEYAAMLVRTRQAERGLGRRALTDELKRKGIVGEAAADALEAVDADDEEAAARRVVEKRLRSMRTLETDVKRRRLVAMLARKGHSAGMSYRIVDEALRSDAS